MWKGVPKVAGAYPPRCDRSSIPSRTASWMGSYRSSSALSPASTSPTSTSTSAVAGYGFACCETRVGPVVARATETEVTLPRARFLRRHTIPSSSSPSPPSLRSSKATASASRSCSIANAPKSRTHSAPPCSRIHTRSYGCRCALGGESSSRAFID